MNMMRSCSAFMVVVLLSGCSVMPDMSEVFSPREFGQSSPMPAYLRNIPEGKDSFSVGWRDGCNTYLGFTGSGLVQMRGFTYDINRSLTDKEYTSGFREGANLCMYYTDTRPN